MPHRQLHARAWTLLPFEMRKAWGNAPQPLFALATSADSRKHTDSLEAARHYLDFDDLENESIDIWGQRWREAELALAGGDTSTNPRRFGVLPWQLEWTYRRLVLAMSPPDSLPPDLPRVQRAAADLGHYLADAHVPLHTSGNYDGQRTNQRGIHALWETRALEWMMLNERRTCPPCNLSDRAPYDPIWTPWQVIQESHAMVPDVLEAHLVWDSLCQKSGMGFQRRGRTMHLAPTPEAMDLWDSLTFRSTWPRHCLAAERVALAWHGAWLEAGQPVLSTPKRVTLWEQLKSYLPLQ